MACLLSYYTTAAVRPSQDSPKDFPAYKFLPKIIGRVVHHKVGGILPRITIYYACLRYFPNFEWLGILIQYLWLIYLSNESPRPVLALPHLLTGNLAVCDHRLKSQPSSLDTYLVVAVLKHRLGYEAAGASECEELLRKWVWYNLEETRWILGSINYHIYKLCTHSPFTW